MNKYDEITDDAAENEIKHIGKEYYEIKITQDTTLFVDRKTGKILGPQGEGTLAIVFYAGVPESKNSLTSRLETERAIRIPRLLQSDSLLNYHIAEISFYEGKQAYRYTGDHYLLSAMFFHNLTHEIPIRMPNDLTRRPCYVGFYLSPNSEYKICLLSEESAFPDIFENYVNEKYGSTSELFQAIKASLRNFSPSKMDKIIFIPHHEREEADKACDDKKENQPIWVGRENLNRLYSDKEANGWWFNLPVAGYPWMSADLQRLLTGYLDDDETKHFKGLESWNVDSWAEMIQNLAQGLYYLHQRGGVHGDIRPANIMTNVYEERELLPDQFKWIDVGLASDEFTEFSDDLKTAITPRPLGDERKTPFYAQERNEVLEFEDADKISIRQDQEKGILLSFLWRQRTTDDVVFPLRIKENGSAIRELGKLREGDRIQVREFLFDIKEVNETDMLVNNVYEVGFGRLLIQKSDKELENLIQRLDNASISRYRIYKQWSQATDIYGFGVLVLYLFYMRGLYNFKQSCKITEDQELPSNTNELAFNRLRQERTFEEFILLLKNQSFLEIFLHHLSSVTELKTTQEMWNLKDEKEIKDKLSDLTETIIGLDPTSALILDGVGSYRLFIQIIYFALCCLWRKDEADEVMLPAAKLEYHQLVPFCTDRFKIRDSQPELPAKAMKEAIDQIIRQNHKNEFIELTAKRERGEIGATWQKRITSLRKQVEGLEKSVHTLTEEKKELKEEIKNLKTENKAAHADIGNLNVTIENLETDNKRLKTKLKDLCENYKLLQTNDEKLNTEHNKIKKEFETLSKENRCFKEKLDTLRKENLETKNYLETLTQDNTALENSLDELRKENLETKTHLDTLTQDNTALEDSLDELNKQSIAFKTKVNSELFKLHSDINEKHHSFEEAAKHFSSTLSGAYKKADVDQFLNDMFSFLEQVSNKISKN